MAHSHIAHWQLYALRAIPLFALYLLWVIPSIYVNSVVPRRLKRKLAALTDIFDSGTAELQKGYIRGLFRGRPGSVSATFAGPSFPTPRICGQTFISVYGHFYLPFEVQTTSARRLGTIRRMLTFFYISIWMFFSFIIPIRITTLTTVSVWTLFGALLAAIFSMRLVLHVYGRLSGYSEESSAAKFELQLAGMRLEPFETYLPDRFRGAISRPEIRESLTRIFDSCRPDSVKAPSAAPIAPVTHKYGNWNYSIGAAWDGPEKFLKKDFLNKQIVRETLTELSALCAEAEHVLPEGTKV